MTLASKALDHCSKEELIDIIKSAQKYIDGLLSEVVQLRQDGDILRRQLEAAQLLIDHNKLSARLEHQKIEEALVKVEHKYHLATNQKSGLFVDGAVAFLAETQAAEVNTSHQEDYKKQPKPKARVASSFDTAQREMIASLTWAEKNLAPQYKALGNEMGNKAALVLQNKEAFKTAVKSRESRTKLAHPNQYPEILVEGLLMLDVAKVVLGKVDDPDWTIILKVLLVYMGRVKATSYMDAVAGSGMALLTEEVLDRYKLFHDSNLLAPTYQH